MEKSVKAALLSALVYPGAGHYFLKKNIMCVVFVIAFSVPFYFIISDLIEKAEHVVEQIENGKIPLDITAISESLTQSTVGVAAQELNVSMYLLVIIWLVGIVDSYRIGRIKNSG